MQACFVLFSVNTCVEFTVKSGVGVEVMTPAVLYKDKAGDILDFLINKSHEEQLNDPANKSCMFHISQSLL